MTFHSGEVAKATGVSSDTIRHYERIGVLPKAARTTSGYRVYPECAVERVRVIQRALRIGFTLSELADIFAERDAGDTPCGRVFDLAQAKLAGIEADIVALQQTRRCLVKVLADWEGRIHRAGSQKAHLLQSLTDVVKQTGGRPMKFRRKLK